MKYVPKLHVNLLSVSQFVSNECIVKSCNDEAIAIAPHKNILYEINFIKVYEADTADLV